ncbi:ABC transporter permease [Buchananella hordeovulneris]|uniref:Sugar ABC transporter permease n=1 Tax=Buchananella hordeovulneris TaxID=52770 RepID=A0A1Q5PV18_9ACTO|nr:ABC transporter permease [Buchananella hordeovulneris]MDO5081453.1 ABC transporter permease [Buchananella hordeovulneris]OKL51275.1 sugar ABC transporter permease [Buchananella hordeovulneris]RRD43415.1 ABC transporter permease [Buchananella hordeovulneris]RRD51032.1 ABC transporter permease [Buchananella hordeovulneris]
MPPEIPLARRAFSHHLFWPCAALVLLLLGCQLVSPGFLRISVQDGHLFGQLIDILRAAATPALLGLGMCLVVATAGVDLSVGAVMAISLSVSLTFLDASQTPGAVSTALTAVGLGLLVAVGIGVFNGLLVTACGIQPFIATMILMVAGRGIAMLITKGQITTVTSPPFKSLGSGFTLGLPTPVICGLVAFVLLALLLRRTALGLLLESVGINAEAARLSGVRANQLKFLTYVLCALCAGLAGLLYGAPTMAADANNIGLMKELDAIMCVVIGGTRMSGGRFFLAGTVVGALVLTTIERAVIIFHIPTQTTPLFKALIVIAVCIAQSAAFQRWAQQRRARAEVARRAVRQEAA